MTIEDWYIVSKFLEVLGKTGNTEASAAHRGPVPGITFWDTEANSNLGGEVKLSLMEVFEHLGIK